MAMAEERRHVLLTGAAGNIGRAFFNAERERYWFRLADRLPIPPESLGAADAPNAHEHEAVRLEISDLAACRAACAGMDTVVHLAADPSPEAAFYESLLENNIVGTFNIFRAAKDAGCRRVIFASSAWAVNAYPDDVQVSESAQPMPGSLYGVSKSFGESLAAYFGRVEGLSSIAIRIGAYDTGSPDNWMRTRAGELDPATYLSARDMNQLLTRCIEAPDTVTFAIAHGLSDNRYKRLDLTATRALLGYAPQDDGFDEFPIFPKTPPDAG